MAFAFAVSIFESQKWENSLNESRMAPTGGEKLEKPMSGREYRESVRELKVEESSSGSLVPIDFGHRLSIEK